jgi:hypothetical protein
MAFTMCDYLPTRARYSKTTSMSFLSWGVCYANSNQSQRLWLGNSGIHAAYIKTVYSSTGIAVLYHERNYNGVIVLNSYVLDMVLMYI